MSATSTPGSASSGSDSVRDSAAESWSERRIRRLVAEFERSLRESLPKKNEPKTLEQIERLSDEIGEAVKESIQRDTLEQQGTGFTGSRVCCVSCRRPTGARYRGEQARQVVTLHGSICVPRAYYYCVHCKRGFCPLDRQLGIGAGQLSAAVVALLCRFASYLSFREAARELEIVCGVRLSPRTINRYAAAVGQQTRQAVLAQLQQTHEERREHLHGLPCQQVRRALEAGDPSEQDKICPPNVRPERQQITMDGVLIHVGGQWREVKLGCVYRPDRKSGADEARYCATLADSARFGGDLHALAAVSGSLKCRKVAVVADGAEWIWQQTGKYFASRTQILDFYHASDHLWSIARAWHGDKTEAEKAAAKQWVAEQKERFLAGNAAAVVTAIETWEAQTREDKDIKRRESGYFREHLSRGRLNYPAFISEGFNIGSGVIESGCKAVVQSRMKGAGMRWSQPGAQAMLQLRTEWCSHQGADFSHSARAAVTLA